MEYLNITETAEKWGISPRRLQTLCATGKVEGATRFGRAWMIPKNTQKPIDGANNRNATLTITLTAGNIYYLEAFRYGTPYNYNLIMQPTS